MPRSEQQPERAPEPVERFVKQLLVVYKATKLYPAASEIPGENATELLRMLHLLLRESPDLRFLVTKDGLLYNALPVLPGAKPFEAFARECYHRHLAEVRFHSGATVKDVLAFCRVLQVPPEELLSAGGFEQRLWDMQVDGVSVRATSTKILDTDLEDASVEIEQGEPWPPTHERIDELVDAAYGARPRDQRMLVRFTQNPRLVARYLQELSSTGRGGRPLTNLIAGKVVSLAHAATAELAEDQPALFRSIAEALLGLDPDVRRGVLIDRLLPDSRVDDTIASVMRQFEIGELCKALVEGLSPDPVSRDGLSRAIRNLAVISLQPKDVVLAGAGQAMADEQMDDDFITSVLDSAAPAQLRGRHPDDAEAGDLESIVRLVDLAPVAAEVLDAESGALRAEVAQGISDGDVLLAIVTLVTIERRDEMFASLMGIIEDGLGLLLEWGEFGDAVHAAASLVALEGDETLDEAQHQRIDAALRSMAHPKYMRDVTVALRFHGRETPEAESCRRLLSILGSRTIAPLLEVLANEQDMTARKSLVDLISGLAAPHIEELGARIADPRWYFVRNVVAILGSTRNPEVLSMLAHTLRHQDVRVRRETIRAAASIRTRAAEDMIIAALTDEDAQNVGLAARYLGVVGAVGASGALTSVALGEGRGNRDMGVRIEAIEALGRLATPQAEAGLQDVLRQRAFLGAGRVREVRTAAEAALAAIQRSRQAGGV